MGSLDGPAFRDLLLNDGREAALARADAAAMAVAAAGEAAGAAHAYRGLTDYTLDDPVTTIHLLRRALVYAPGGDRAGGARASCLVELAQAYLDAAQYADAAIVGKAAVAEGDYRFTGRLTDLLRDGVRRASADSEFGAADSLAAALGEVGPNQSEECVRLQLWVARERVRSMRDPRWGWPAHGVSGGRDIPLDGSPFHVIQVPQGHIELGSTALPVYAGDASDRPPGLGTPCWRKAWPDGRRQKIAVTDFMRGGRSELPDAQLREMMDATGRFIGSAERYLRANPTVPEARPASHFRMGLCELGRQLGVALGDIGLA